MADTPTVSKLHGRATIGVKLAPNTNLEQIQKVIAEIGRLNGCLPCGLLGIDVRLTGDPVELGALAHLPGVQGVQFG
ncbi:MAG: hypothetical protein KGN84_05175 [Acidobacteriota bacterium]|nr:hypothetical protein [Acidobacteriota bacterium]